MNALANLLRRYFACDGGLPANCQDMTLHDALRLGGRSLAERPASNRRPPSRPVRSCFVDRYASDEQLADCWQRFDRAEFAAPLTIILLLDGRVRWGLRRHVARLHRASRLVVVPRAGCWPGTDSAGDLALASQQLGWDRIEVERDHRAAWEAGMASLDACGSLIVLVPDDV